MIDKLLQLRGIGRSSAERIAEEFQTWENFEKAILQEEENPILKSILKKFYSEVKEQILKLKQSENSRAPFSFDAEESEITEIETETKSEKETEENRNDKSESEFSQLRFSSEDFEKEFYGRIQLISKNKYKVDSAEFLQQIKKYLSKYNIGVSVTASWDGLFIELEKE